MTIRDATLFFFRWTIARQDLSAEQEQELSAATDTIRDWQSRPWLPTDARVERAIRTMLSNMVPRSDPLPPEAVAEFNEAHAALTKWRDSR